MPNPKLSTCNLKRLESVYPKNGQCQYEGKLQMTAGLGFRRKNIFHSYVKLTGLHAQGAARAIANIAKMLLE